MRLVDEHWTELLRKVREVFFLPVKANNNNNKAKPKTEVIRLDAFIKCGSLGEF